MKADAIERALRVIGRPQNPEHVIAARALLVPGARSCDELWDWYRDTNMTAEVWLIASMAYHIENSARLAKTETYPWVDGYPLVGQVVKYDDRYWMVMSTGVTCELSSEDGPGEVLRTELRPATWTAKKELELTSPPMGGFVTEL